MKFQFDPSDSRPVAPRMYSKDLSRKLTLRLSDADMDFISWLARRYSCTDGAALRMVLRSYRSSLDMQDSVASALGIPADVTSSVPPFPLSVTNPDGPSPLVNSSDISFDSYAKSDY